MPVDLGAVLTPIVTPFDARGRVDEEAAVRLMHHLLEHGSDGLLVYAGNDDVFADALDMGGPGGILVSAHLFGEELHRMVDEPDRRREIDASLQDVYRDLAVAPLACSTKAALNMIGLALGGPRLPYVELDERETGVIRAMLERHGLLEPARA